MSFSPPNALQIRITLAEINPAIWRRLVVPRSWSLDQLHLGIQAAFNWWNYHLHEFRIGGLRYGDVEMVEYDFDDDARLFDERDLFRRATDRHLVWSRNGCLPVFLGGSWPPRALSHAEDLMTRHEETLRRLYAKAYRRFGVLCLWSKRPVDNPVPGNARTIAASLRVEGDHDARELAAKLERAADAVEAALGAK